MIKHLLEYVIYLNSYRVFFCRFSPFKYSVRYFVRKEPCKIMIIFCHTYFSATEILDLFISDLSIIFFKNENVINFFFDAISFFKVHIFWEDHKILRNLHQLFDWQYIGQKIGEDFAKFFDLLRIYEL